MKPKRPTPAFDTRLTTDEPPTTRIDERKEWDERLDEELDGTFPASDPVPWRHDSAGTAPTDAARVSCRFEGNARQ